MVTGRTGPKENALTSAHRALCPKILFDVLHIIIKKLVLFLYDGVWGVPRSSLLYSRFPRCTWRRCLSGFHIFWYELKWLQNVILAWLFGGNGPEHFDRISGAMPQNDMKGKLEPMVPK